MDRVKEYIRLKSIERKGYRPLQQGPPSPPPQSKENPRYWECPNEKALKSPTSKPLLATSKPPIVFERCYRKRILLYKMRKIGVIRCE
ncbi:hypothetical protein ALC57_09556 [Trachymyrmex cornetzi]|uniref:Uncharacterized protein n=1 Tax=Trachymyrmex cornetzi TaxID=471704 RepID=A0A151J583_9HYME|nr:hypothetical protein ALC57_09556 [Trachymyrmex cornetzi]